MWTRDISEGGYTHKNFFLDLDNYDGARDNEDGHETGGTQFDPVEKTDNPWAFPF